MRNVRKHRYALQFSEAQMEGNLTMTRFKYQSAFAHELANSWVCGNHGYVCTTIRNLKNKAQAAYIASMIALTIAEGFGLEKAHDFVDFIHPNHA